MSFPPLDIRVDLVALPAYQRPPLILTLLGTRSGDRGGHGSSPLPSFVGTWQGTTLTRLNRKGQSPALQDESLKRVGIR